MSLEVYKFGGTCLQTKKNFELLYKLIIQNENKKIIVVSAMGRSGFPYASDSLLNLVNKDFLDEDEYHHLLANGEIISSLVFTNFLKSKGLKTKFISYLKNGIKVINKKLVLDNNYLKEYLKTYDYLVVPGFIGQDGFHEVITLGRGNSDLTAIIMAKMFNLNKVNLYKDVEGVYPFILSPLKNIIPYSTLTYKELELLIINGFKVISLDSLNYARTNGIEINICSFESNTKGTIIKKSDVIEKDYIGLIISNKEFKILCKDANKVAKEMEDEFLNSHILISKEEINSHCYKFIINSSQNLLLKKKIIAKYFNSYIKKI